MRAIHQVRDAGPYLMEEQSGARHPFPRVKQQTRVQPRHPDGWSEPLCCKPSLHTAVFQGPPKSSILSIEELQETVWG